MSDTIYLQSLVHRWLHTSATTPLWAEFVLSSYREPAYWPGT